ncbi:MAG: COG4280 domain-containing protein [Bacillota bacterium]
MAWSSVLPSFLASTVEFVEALTIVLVVGVTINWKSSLLGAGAAVLALAALVAVFGSTLVLFIPISVLRLVIGIVLILFGLQWLKKSLLRYSGLKAMHDEAAIYEDRMRELKESGEIDPGQFSGLGFVTSFKSVLLEGLEVAFIVITFGATAATGEASGLWAAALGALLAFLVVVGLGLAIRAPLTRIPENTLKFITGIMLVSFGTFWGGEGLGIEWPLADLFLLILIGFFLLLSALIVRWLKPHGVKQRQCAAKTTAAAPARGLVVRLLKEVFDFFCGDWRVFWGVAGTMALLELIEHLTALSFALPAAGFIFAIGVSASLITGLGRELAA